MDKRLASTSSPFVHLLILLLIIAIMAFLSAIIMMVIASLFGIPMSEIGNVVNDPSESDLLFLKVLQAIQTLLLFLAPALILPFAIRRDLRDYLFTKINKQRIFWILTPIFVLAIIPMINALAELNSQLSLPENLKGIEQWMVEKEEYAMHLLDKLLRTDNWLQLAGNILLIAILPAIAEEFLFRGALQRILINITKNVHVGILITAILFSAIHMQFFGFVPRFLLGLVFGYLLIWTGSIWIPVLAHFTNNFLGVMYYHFYQGEIQEGYFDTVGATNETIPILVISFIISGLLMFLMYQKRKSISPG